MPEMERGQLSMRPSKRTLERLRERARLLGQKHTTLAGRDAIGPHPLGSLQTGEVAERLNAPVSKTGMGLSVHRGFESPPLRCC